MDLTERHYTAGQAVLLQQPVEALIDTVEGAQYRSRVYNVAAQSNRFIIAERLGNSPISPNLETSATQTSPSLGTGWVVETTASKIKIGDLIPDSWISWAEPAEDTATQTPLPAVGAPAAARFRAERITNIQAVLGFSIVDTARILGVTRQALYHWLDASKDVKLQEASRGRLACIERIAKSWGQHSTSPLASLAQEPLATGQTIMQMMSADIIDERKVMAAFDELARRLQTKPKSPSQKLAQSGATRRGSARALPREE
jgi:hypothetical protein